MAYISFQPSDHFNTKLYTGNGSTQSITGVGFQPDWVWLKRRDASASHELHDAVRGATKRLKSDGTNAEFTDTDTLTSFDSDGFSIGSGSQINTNSATQVSWNWLANGQGSANSDGSINTTYTSANTTSGFSIVKYTGTGANATVGHGLGVAPSMIITKSLVATQEWCVGMDALGWDKLLFLNETSASQSGSTYWQSTAPTNQVFSVGTAGPTNSSSAMIAYCFAEKTGFSKFGSYTGNGNADGAFVYTGFKPAFILIRSVSTTNWNMFDNKRSAFNVADETFWSNSTNSEANVGTSYGIDILSNGFKAKTVSSQVNNNNTVHIFMAFAEAPLVGSNNVPATAR